jgi:hypothetical protein
LGQYGAFLEFQNELMFFAHSILEEGAVDLDKADLTSQYAVMFEIDLNEDPVFFDLVNDEFDYGKVDYAMYPFRF